MEFFASGVATVSSERGRLAIPGDIVKGWKLGEQTGDDVLTVEMVAAGHLRFFRKAMAKDRVEQDRKAAEKGAADAADLERRLRIHRDRYRDASFNKSDKNRVALSQELVLALIGQSKREKVYVEAGSSSIDVMTNEVRFNRNQALDED